MSKVYIAGKINGLKNYKEVFKAVENELIAEGNTVMNPAVLGEGFNYETYMPICLAMLEACEIVLMLNNWQDSKGARVEYEYAKIQGKKIIYQEVEYSIVYKTGDFFRETYIDALNKEAAIKKFKETIGNYEIQSCELSDED